MTTTAPPGATTTPVQPPITAVSTPSKVLPTTTRPTATTPTTATVATATTPKPVSIQTKNIFIYYISVAKIQ